MLAARLRARCASARVIGPGIAPGFAIAFDKIGQDGSGKAALVPGEGAVRLPAAQPDHQPIAPPPLAAAVLAPAVAVPADAPVPNHPRAHWPVALRASAYSLVYRMSYGRGAYRFAARHGASARTAMGHALRKNRPGARPAGRAAHGRAWAGGFSGG